MACFSEGNNTRCNEYDNLKMPGEKLCSLKNKPDTTGTEIMKIVNCLRTVKRI